MALGCYFCIFTCGLGSRGFSNVSDFHLSDFLEQQNPEVGKESEISTKRNVSDRKRMIDWLFEQYREVSVYMEEVHWFIT